MNTFSKALAEAHIADLHREAAKARERATARAALRNTSAFPSVVTLRLGGQADSAALARLAALDSSQIPGAPVLIAEADGELLAALSLSDRVVIADPFHPTAQLVQLLRKRAEQMHQPSRRPSRIRAAARRRVRRNRRAGLAPDAR